MGLDQYVMRVRRAALKKEGLKGARYEDLSRMGLALFDIGDEDDAALCKEIMPYATVADLTRALFDEEKFMADNNIPKEAKFFCSAGGMDTTTYICLQYAINKEHIFPLSDEKAAEIYRKIHKNALNVRAIRNSGESVSFLLYGLSEEKLMGTLSQKELEEYKALPEENRRDGFLAFKNGEFSIRVTERCRPVEVVVNTDDIFMPGGKYTKDVMGHYAIFDISSPIRQWRKDYDLSEAMAEHYKKKGITLLNCGFYPLDKEAKQIIRRAENNCTYISSDSLDAAPYIDECVCYHEWY